MTHISHIADQDILSPFSDQFSSFTHFRSLLLKHPLYKSLVQSAFKTVSSQIAKMSKRNYSTYKDCYSSKEKKYLEENSPVRFEDYHDYIEEELKEGKDSKKSQKTEQDLKDFTSFVKIDPEGPSEAF